MKDAKFFLLAAALLGFVSVALGAFGAHALKDRLAPEQLARFETAVRYQFYHVFALLGVSLLSRAWPGLNFAPAGWAFLAGVIIFSGTLYLIDLTGIRTFGAVTPVGGALLLAGWLLLAWEAGKIL
ncbi:MAG TPA: DUF423 domain-containing protein [Bacteroidota bacterium]|nr:DUF423 domain-containing protein [Bacteroidota bacterium]